MGGQAATPATAGRTNMALMYQEILTAITRFRSGRQAVSDATTFRNQIKAAIGTAEAEATRAGYNAEDVRLGTFAVVAFLDESVLNSNNPLFADWPRMPLQEELFGVRALEDPKAVRAVGLGQQNPRVAQIGNGQSRSGIFAQSGRHG